MREVSCRVFDLVFRDLRAKGLQATILVEGTDCSIEHLRNRQERIDWELYLGIMDNLSRHYSPTDFERLGGSFFRNPMIRPFSLVAQILFDLEQFYERLGLPKEGVGNQLFTCMSGEFHLLGPSRGEMVVVTAPGYTPCIPFFLITKGAFAELPLLFGLPPAQVDLQIEGGKASYSISMPTQRAFLSRVRRALLAPFRAPQLARELHEANAVVVQRYSELQVAQRKIAQQARALQTAHQISNRVHATFDLGRALEVLADALIESGAFVHARVELASSARFAERTLESAGPKPELVHRPLHGRDRLLGRLSVAPKAEQAPGELEQLLEYVVPVVSVAIEEAAAYDELEEYRDQLEEKVAVRTKELSEARDRLAETVGQLREAQSARDRFFANINHEIRNPLTLIALAARRLGESEAARTPATQALLQSVDVNTSRLLSLVDGLLLLAASSETKLRVQPKTLDVAAIVARLTSSFIPRAEDAGVELRVELPGEFEALVDEAAIERILANLLSNALKFTPAGGTVVVRLETEAEDCILSVADTGIGLGEEFKTRAFGRFEQGLAPVRPGERGSGIGLAIVQELARLHGGSVTFADNPGGGSIFSVRWPRTRVAPPAPNLDAQSALPKTNLLEVVPSRTPSISVPAILEPPEGGSATILVAEDEAFLLAEIARTLARRFRVLTAPDGEVALRLAREHQPAALVTDVSMPGMSGFELARAFRAEGGDRLAPILFVTAHGNLGQRLEGFESGGVDYVLKPFHPEELFARVCAQMEQRQKAMRMEESERLASLGFLTAGIAHEFRNPANAVINALKPLKKMLPPGALEPKSPTRAMLEVIEGGAAQLQSLSQQILSLASGDDVATTGTHSLAEIIDRAVDLLGPTLQGIEVRRDRNSEPGLIASPFVLSQAFANLLENAAHAIGGPGWIEITTRRSSEGLIVRVSDSGPGVPRKIRGRIFEPFFTTKDPGKGTGLGLPTVRRVVEKHGGSIHVVELSRGTAFEIMFPERIVVDVERTPTKQEVTPRSPSP